MTKLSPTAQGLVDLAAEKKLKDQLAEYGFDSLEDAKKAVDDAKAAATRSQAFRIPGMDDDKELKERWSWDNVARGLAEGDLRRYADYEMQVSDEMRRAYAQGTAPDPSGGVLIPGVVDDEFFINYLWEPTTLSQLGVTVKNQTTTPVWINAVTETLTPGPTEVAEHQEIVEGEMEFGNLRSEPRTVGIAVRASNRVLQMSNIGSYLQEHIGESLSQRIEWLGYNGQGATNQPTGILNAAGVDRVDFSAASEVAPSGAFVPKWEYYERLLEMRRQLRKAKIRNQWPIRFAACVEAVDMARMVAGRETTLASGDVARQEMANHLISEGDVPRMIGYEYVDSSELAGGVADSTLILGAFPTMVMNSWGGTILDSTREGEGTFKRRQTLFMAYRELDFVYRYPQAIKVAQNLNTVGI